MIDERILMGSVEELKEVPRRSAVNKTKGGATRSSKRAAAEPDFSIREMFDPSWATKFIYSSRE